MIEKATATEIDECTKIKAVLERLVPELMEHSIGASDFLEKNELTSEFLKTVVERIPDQVIPLFAPPESRLNFNNCGSGDEVILDIAYLATGNLVINEGVDGIVVSGTHFGLNKSLSRNMVANAIANGSKFICGIKNENVVRILVSK